MNKFEKKIAVPSRRGRIPASEVEDRKDGILDSATKEFLESGFDRATVTAIAKKADAPSKRYTPHTPIKKPCSGSDYPKASSVFEAVGTLSPDREIREALERYASEMIVLMERSDTRGLHRLVIGESRNFPEVAKNFWKEGYARGIEVLTEYLTTKRSSGKPAIKNPTRAAQVFMALLLGDMTMRGTLGLKTLTEIKKQQREWAQTTVDLFVGMIEQGKVWSLQLPGESQPCLHALCMRRTTRLRQLAIAGDHGQVNIT